MNCPECGHETKEHKAYGCNHKDTPDAEWCECLLSRDEAYEELVEAWKREAAAAHSYILDLEFYGSEAKIIPEMKKIFLAARVPDATEPR